MAVSTKAKKKQKKHGLLKFILFLALVYCAVILAKKLPFDMTEITSLFSSNSGEPVAVTENANPYDGYISENKYGNTSDSLDAETLDKINAIAAEDNRVYDVIMHIGDYPNALISLLAKNPDARDFVLDYPEHLSDTGIGKIDNSELKGGIPHFLQWDERWGYYTYGSGVLGVTGCGPTCLSMVIVGLTGNEDATPAAVADFSINSGYYVDGSGTTWELMSVGATNYGLTSMQLPLSEDSMIAEISSGHPLIVNVGPGDFTGYGHFIVITGYENGLFTVNDPNSKKLSDEGWYYTTLESQIKNIWSYSIS